jgi:hypothetical protein
MSKKMKMNLLTKMFPLSALATVLTLETVVLATVTQDIKTIFILTPALLITLLPQRQQEVQHIVATYHHR